MVLIDLNILQKGPNFFSFYTFSNVLEKGFGVNCPITHGKCLCLGGSQNAHQKNFLFSFCHHQKRKLKILQFLAEFHEIDQ